jgi:hypothetical protein
VRTGVGTRPISGQTRIAHIYRPLKRNAGRGCFALMA